MQSYKIYIQIKINNKKKQNLVNADGINVC